MRLSTTSPLRQDPGWQSYRWRKTISGLGADIVIHVGEKLHGGMPDMALGIVVVRSRGRGNGISRGRGDMKRVRRWQGEQRKMRSWWPGNVCFSSFLEE